MHFVGAHSFAEDPATACVVCGEGLLWSVCALCECVERAAWRLLDLEIDDL